MADDAPAPGDGVYLSWQYCPSLRSSHDQLPVPFSAIVPVLQTDSNVPTTAVPPTACHQCSACLNSYCQLDFGRGTWTCALCGTTQALPAMYRGYSESSFFSEALPPELQPGVSVVDHMLSSAPASPVCVLVLDLCMPPSELELMKQAVSQSIDMLPESTYLGLITFGAMVHVHELLPSSLASSIMCHGMRVARKEDLLRGMGAKGRGASRQVGPGSSFLAPVGDCQFAVDTVLECMDPENEAAPGKRLARATGAALSAAVSLLEACAPGVGGRVLLFTSGPCTRGPGKIVDVDQAEPFRVHKDLVNGRAKWYAGARKFYDGLARRLITNGQCLDVFACSLDQTGLSEMQHMVFCTGGLMVMAETYDHAPFRRSLARLLQPDADGNLNWTLNATFAVTPGSNLSVRGAIGTLASLERKGPGVADQSVGLGGSLAWKMNAVAPGAAVVLYFEPTATAKDRAPKTGTPLYFQVRVTYHDPSGRRRMRVLTKSSYFVDASTPVHSLGFDAHTAAVALGRWVVYEAQQQADSPDVGTWLDRQLVSMAKRLATFRKDDAASVSFPPEFAQFPEIVFHLRRSVLLNVFGNAPDETVFYRLLLFREGRDACLLMMRPRLLSYAFDGGPPVDQALDIASVREDTVCLLDSWFHVLVHTGTHVAGWIKQGLLDDPAYAHVKETVDAAHAYSQALLDQRNPLPRLVTCNQGTSQARFLLVRLNPSKTQETSAAGAVGSVVYTDDVSYDVFLSQLHKLTVS